MNTKNLFVLLFASVLFISSCNNSGSNSGSLVSLKTTLGEIKIRLYNETPGHRDNFLKLVETGAYDGVLFHRVINGFMIQGGDPTTRDINPAAQTDTINNYTIPAEFNPALFHKKGALAAARENNNVNPEMRSSGTQFYIVQGKVLNDADLVSAEERINNNIRQALLYRTINNITDSVKKAGGTMTEAEIQEKAFLRQASLLEKAGYYRIPEDQKAVYKTTGGVARLDQTYTVFGEVTEGLEIVDRIAATKTNEQDKPLDDIRVIKARIIRK
ncbi:MAG: peptidylprolyl isomerase [Bacteroidales bacterium]